MLHSFVVEFMSTSFSVSGIKCHTFQGSSIHSKIKRYIKTKLRVV